MYNNQWVYFLLKMYFWLKIEHLYATEEKLLTEKSKLSRFQQYVYDVCEFQFDWFMTLRRRGVIFDEKCFSLALEVSEAAA